MEIFIESKTRQFKDTKGKIFFIAAQLFAEKGYRQLSVREICEKANISKPVLYYYFKDKKTLFLKLLEESDKITESLIKEYIEKEENYLDKFHGIFRLHLKFLLQYPVFVKFFFLIHFMSLDPDIKEKVVRQNKSRFQRLQAFLEQGRVDNIIRPDVESFTVAISIFGSIRYLMLYFLNNPFPQMQIEDQIEKLFYFWKSNLFIGEG